MATEPKPMAAAPAPKLADRLADDKRQLAEERDARAKAAAEREKKRGTPTPTQDELDLMKLGHHPELADDGSGPDPTAATNTVKHIGGKPAGSYSTRAMSS